MAPPCSAMPPRPPSRSRFQEGSMNDRASAAPPVHIIGPEEPTSFEKPPFIATIRPIVSEDRPPPPQPTVSKRGSKQLLGQVWGGMMEKLGIRKDAAPEKKQVQRPVAVVEERPTRDEVYANYHHLVASGFFSSHAIQSTRQPGAGRSPSSTRPSSAHPSQYPSQLPQWPLPQEPLTPKRTRPSSPVKFPASASSRGTKRAAGDPDEDDEEHDDYLRNHRKLRKTASATRDVSSPKLRSSSRLAARRSFSNATSRKPSSTAAPPPSAPSQREPNKLTKRVLGKLPLQVPERGSSTSGNASETRENKSRMSQDDSRGGRTLRPRGSAAEPLRVRPDANRGIPSVPGIPTKFTYGEDRENAGPWRGLRRAN